MVGDDIISTGSLIEWVDRKHGSNLLYDELWDEGCVFYARTTQPQTIMHLETISNLWGRTDNPYNRDLTPGGSSGGESALVGMRGSLFVSQSNLTVGWKAFMGDSLTGSRVSAAILVAVSAARPSLSASTASSKHTHMSISQPRD